MTPSGQRDLLLLTQQGRRPLQVRRFCSCSRLFYDAGESGPLPEPPPLGGNLLCFLSEHTEELQVAYLGCPWAITRQLQHLGMHLNVPLKHATSQAGLHRGKATKQWSYNSKKPAWELLQGVIQHCFAWKPPQPPTLLHCTCRHGGPLHTASRSPAAHQAGAGWWECLCSQRAVQLSDSRGQHVHPSVPGAAASMLLVVALLLSRFLWVLAKSNAQEGAQTACVD